LIDGVKIKVFNTDSALWQTHEGLDFAMSVSTRTGEVLTHKPLLADLKGLSFKITPSVVNPSKPIMHILGSLTKYKSGGRDNVENLTYSQLCEVIEDLKNYHVDPSVSRLENIEFGLNIDLPFGCDAVLNSIVSMPTKPMTELRVEKTTIGKRCDFQEYEIKIYDKGKAENHKASNVLRVELRVKKMQFLKKTNIRTLLDLTDKHQLAHAGAMLLKSLNDVIMFNYDFEKLDDLTPSVREKVLHWTNPKTWKAWTRYQRRRHLQDMEAFQNESEAGNIKAVLMQAVYKNWCDLVGSGSGFDTDFTNILKTQYPKIAYNLGLIGCRFDSDRHDLTKLHKENGETVLSERNNLSNINKENGNGLTGKSVKNGNGFEDKTGENGETVLLKNGNGFDSVCNNLSIKINGYFVNNKKTTTTKRGVRGGGATITKHETKLYLGVRVCLSCEIDISHKRPQSVFCSDRCRIKSNNPNRDRRKAKTQKEPKPKKPKPTPSVSKPIIEPKPESIKTGLEGLVMKMKM
jgi:hypothetical protein